jgi:hypothetical protein
MPFYRTRVLTARDRLLVDKLAQHPRYARLVDRLTGASQPPQSSPKPAARAPERASTPEPAPEPQTTEPAPEPTPEPAPVSKPTPNKPSAK